MYYVNCTTTEFYRNEDNYACSRIIDSSTLSSDDMDDLLEDIAEYLNYNCEQSNGRYSDWRQEVNISDIYVVQQTIPVDNKMIYSTYAYKSKMDKEHEDALVQYQKHLDSVQKRRDAKREEELKQLAYLSKKYKQED